MNTGQLFYDVMEHRYNWVAQHVSFKTSEMCDLLWINKSTLVEKEVLEKFHVISYIPKLQELLEHDFIVGAILRVLNFQKPVKSKHKSLLIHRFYMENFSLAKNHGEIDKSYSRNNENILKYEGMCSTKSTFTN